MEVLFLFFEKKTCEPLYWGYFSWVLQWLRDLGVPLVTERTGRYRAECGRFRGSDVGLFLSWVYLPSYIFCKILVYRSIYVSIFFVFPSVFLSFYVFICWFSGSTHGALLAWDPLVWKLICKSFSFDFLTGLSEEKELQSQMSHEKNPLTFHYTGCLIEILIMVYYNPHITR